MSDTAVFIVGLHRTGSTLLRNILHAHPAVSMLEDELHLFDYRRRGIGFRLARQGTRFCNALEALEGLVLNAATPPPGTYWRIVAPRLSTDERLRDILRQQPATPEGILRGLLVARREEHGVAIAGAKYPVAIPYLGWLGRAVPGCRIIHLTRDPRAIIASKLGDQASRHRIASWPLPSLTVRLPTGILFLAQYWISAVVHVAWRRHDQDYRLVHYEDLVSFPRETVMALCRWLRLPFDESMLTVTGKPSSHGTISKSGIRDTTLEAWRHRMSLPGRLAVSGLSFLPRRFLQRDSRLLRATS